MQCCLNLVLRGGILFVVRDHFGICLVVLNPNGVLRKYKICNYCSTVITLQFFNVELKGHFLFIQ